MEIDPNDNQRANANNNNNQSGRANANNNNQSGQPVPPQGIPPVSSQDVRNHQEDEEAKQDGAPVSPAHQLNPSNSEATNRAIEAFTRRMALMQGLAGPEHQELRVPPQLPQAPVEDPEDDDQEMRSEEKEEKKEEKKEDNDEDEYLAAEGDTLCSICYHPYEYMVPDGQACDCIATPGNEAYDYEDHQWHKHICMFCHRKAHWHCWHRHIKIGMDRERQKAEELNAAIEDGSILELDSTDPIWDKVTIRTPCCRAAITRDNDWRTQQREPRGYDEHAIRPQLDIMEEWNNQQRIRMEEEELRERMIEEDRLQRIQQQRNNLQDIHNLQSILPDNDFGNTPVTSEDELEDGQILEEPEEKKQQEQKEQQPDNGSRIPPQGSTASIRRRMYHTMMAKAYHRLITLNHFKLISFGHNRDEAYDMERWIIEGYLGHTGYRASPRFPIPTVILDAPDNATARQICVDFVKAIASVAKVDPAIQVIRWRSTRSRNPGKEWIGTIMKLQRVHHRNQSNNQQQPRPGREYAVYKKPTIDEQNILYRRFNNDQYTPYRRFDAQRHAYQVDWIRYCQNAENLPNQTSSDRQWNRADRIPNTPPFAHTIHATTRQQRHAQDLTRYEWTGPRAWNERLNCFQEVYDQNGNRIGRESDVRLHYKGLRCLQTVTRDNAYPGNKKVTGIIYVQYPQDWSLYKDDFRMTVTFWRADEIIRKCEEEDVAHLRRTLRDTMLYIRASNITNEYLQHYEKDGRKRNRQGRYGR